MASLLYDTPLYDALLSMAAVFNSDYLVIGVLTTIFFFYGMRYGKQQLLLLLLSFLVGGFILFVFPYWSVIESWAETAREALYFKLATSFTVLFLARFVVKNIADARSIEASVRPVLEMLVYSLLFAGMFLTLFYKLFTLSDFYAFTHPLDTVLADEKALFFWLILALAILYLLKKRSRW